MDLNGFRLNTQHAVKQAGGIGINLNKGDWRDGSMRNVNGLDLMEDIDDKRMKRGIELDNKN